jgi:hypothetical protein
LKEVYMTKKALIIAFLAIFLTAGIASAHMRGGRPGYRHHVAFTPKAFPNPEAQKKFLAESYPLRKELNEKKFDLREALRLEHYKEAGAIRTDIHKLRMEIGKIAKNNGWSGPKLKDPEMRKRCPGPQY